VTVPWEIPDGLLGEEAQKRKTPAIPNEEKVPEQIAMDLGEAAQPKAKTTTRRKSATRKTTTPKSTTARKTSTRKTTTRRSSTRKKR